MPCTARAKTTTTKNRKSRKPKGKNSSFRLFCCFLGKLSENLVFSGATIHFSEPRYRSDHVRTNGNANVSPKSTETVPDCFQGGTNPSLNPNEPCDSRQENHCHQRNHSCKKKLSKRPHRRQQSSNHVETHSNGRGQETGTPAGNRHIHVSHQPRFHQRFQHRAIPVLKSGTQHVPSEPASHQRDYQPYQFS